MTDLLNTTSDKIVYLGWIVFLTKTPGEQVNFLAPIFQDQGTVLSTGFISENKIREPSFFLAFVAFE